MNSPSLARWIPALSWLRSYKASWLRGVLAGAIVYAVLRLAAMVVYFRREFGQGLQLSRTLWCGQLLYALPFGLAVGVEIVQANLHQYFVASRFNA